MKMKRVYKAMFHINFFFGIVVFIQNIYVFIFNHYDIYILLFDMILLLIIIACSSQRCLDADFRCMYPEKKLQIQVQDEKFIDIVKLLLFLFKPVMCNIYLLYIFSKHL